VSNIYRHKFFSHCPNNGQPIEYTVEITVPKTSKIMVEHIVTAGRLCDNAYHERIADCFFDQFGGQQVITAHHHGVDIETRRGFADEICCDGRLTQRVIVGNTTYEKGVEAIHAIKAASRQATGCDPYFDKECA
jgi:hypothetical protein